MNEIYVVYEYRDIPDECNPIGTASPVCYFNSKLRAEKYVANYSNPCFHEEWFEKQYEGELFVRALPCGTVNHEMKPLDVVSKIYKKYHW